MKKLQQQVIELLTIPNSELEKDEARRAHLTNIIIIAFTLVSVTVLSMTVFTNNIPAMVKIVTAVYVLFLLALQFILRRGNVDIVSKLLIASSVIGITLVLASTGTIRDPAVVFYLFGCIAAALIIGRKAANVTALASCAAILILYYAELNQLLPPPVLSVTITQAIVIIIAIVLTILLLNIATGNIDEALTRVREELQRRKLAEQALKESEERYRIISSVTSDYTFSSRLDAEGELEHILLTGAFEQITGYKPDEFLEIGGWRTTLHPDDTEEDAKAMQGLFLNERAFSEVRIIKKGGEVRWVRVSAQPIWDDSQDRLVGINGGVQDITERKQLELQPQKYNTELEILVRNRTEALQRAKEQIEIIINNTSDAILFANSNGDILLTNPAFGDNFGRKEFDTVDNIFGTLANRDQVTLISKAISDAINQKAPQQVVIRVLSPHDASTRDIDVAIIPVSSVDNSQDGVIFSGRDITQQREIERFKERFVADALHDLATPISAITTRTYLLQRSPEKLEEHVKALQNQAKHLKNLLEDLRTLSRLDQAQIELDLKLCDLNELVRRIYDTYEPVALEKKQTLHLDLAPSLPEILLDSRQIERVLVNLVSNAVNYTPEDREITIQTQTRDQHVILSVIDQGNGVEEEDLSRVFERFYRSSDARQNHQSGTGLGLAITEEIVELHGGTVGVESKVGQGSTFWFHIPVGGESQDNLL